MWFNMYNARLYIYDIPVFYTPYFGYSLDTTRQTGLLMPSVGISSDEGFYYEQPFKLEVIGIQSKTIDKDNMEKINGGSHYSSSLFYLFKKHKNQLILENFLPCFTMSRSDFIFTTC